MQDPDQVKDNKEKTTQWVREIALAGSHTAFKSLYMSYFQRLMRFTNLYVSDPVAAEEIVSDTFISLWENRTQLLEVRNFDSYIFTIIRYKAINYYRNKNIEFLEINGQPFDLYYKTETTPEDDLISKEETERLNNAINSLPNKCKIAFKLVREDNLKYKEVATIMDISVKTLEAHLATAIRKLRQILKQNKK
ncbi:MAG: RNA polymerase sigma-70 factor [Tannerellaceae bacterium]|nr:RNA polymerase sigma-70 factor [Tannerellaceae bacterium]